MEEINGEEKAEEEEEGRGRNEDEGGGEEWYEQPGAKRHQMVSGTLCPALYCFPIVVGL